VKIVDLVSSASGDSGGPLYIPDGNDWLLAGLDSRAAFVVQERLAELVKEGANPATAEAARAVAELAAGMGSIYVRVDQYLDFINDAKAKARQWQAEHPGQTAYSP